MLTCATQELSCNCLPHRSLGPEPLSVAPLLSPLSTWPFALCNPSCSSQSPEGGNHLTSAPALSPAYDQTQEVLGLVNNLCRTESSALLLFENNMGIIRRQGRDARQIICMCFKFTHKHTRAHLAKDLLIDGERKVQDVSDVVVFHPLQRLVKLLV